ncbi:MAG: SDR family oxidoreductase [Bacteroidetes bacterium]|jgi:short-subunit dehydrogenase|nr:SDR family oxidoreductase [Bacteroidota bacterium]
MNVIITGASKGIGKAIAQTFAAAGNQLFLCARNAATLEATAKELTAAFPSSTIHWKAADLSKKEEVQLFADWCLSFGDAGILINNAGIYLPGDASNEADGFLEMMMNTNLYSAYHLSRKIIPSMIHKGSGHIFNICSVASMAAYNGGGGYSISKFALHGFTKNLRHELKPKGIKVTGVYPGAVLTDSWGNFDNSNKRIMEATDIAAMVFAAAHLSVQAVVDEIIITPQLGEL